MKFAPIYKSLLLTSICVLLAACGQQGPLYHPGTQTPYGQPEYSPLHPEKTTDTKKEKRADNSTKHDNTQKTPQKTQ